MDKLVINKFLRLVVHRSFTTGNVLHKSREGRFMTKIMKGNTTKRKWQNNVASPLPVMISATNLAKGAAEGKHSGNSRRVSVLNKLFMRHITDLMATGENAAEFLGRGIEINRVMVTPDFKGVNVFWIAKGTEIDEELESLLAKNAGALRHELSQLRVMGVVPMIKFVKDKEYAKLMEVDLRLSKADFGDDYISVEPSYRFNSAAYLNTPLPSHVKEKIEALETEEIEDDEFPLPPMRMDVLGLNHCQIMSKVKQAKKKSQALHRKNIDNSQEKKLANNVNDDPIEFDSHKQQKEAFQQFLIKRQILKAKVDREKKKSYPEYEYMRVIDESVSEDFPLSDELTESIPDFIEEPEDNVKI